MNNNKKTAARIVMLVLLGLMMGLNLYALSASSLAGNKLPTPFGIGVATVQSNSMQPTLSKGDLLIVQQKSEYSEGDVVVYQSQTSLVVHRIIKVSGTTITTQGDANNTPDARFDESCIKGAVIGSIPVLGLVVDYFKTPLGILFILVLAVFLIELSFRRQKRAIHSKEEQKKRALRREIQQLKDELNNTPRV